MKWKICVLFAILSIMLTTLIVLLVVLLPDNQSPTRNLFSFEDVFDPEMQPKKSNARWILSQQDGVVTYRKNGNIFLRKLPENERIFIAEEEIKFENGTKVDFFDYWISSDEKYILLATDQTKIWRHSFTAFYFIFEVESKKILNLFQDEKTQLAIWSPTGHSIAFVKGNNLYLYENLENLVEITTDGNENIFNAVPSWVYEEEVLGGNQAIWWSPDSKNIAFLKIDETQVEDFFMPVYEKRQYPRQVKIKYPKPGTTNPSVKLLSFEIETNVTTSINFSYGKEFIIFDVAWRSTTNILARLTNRNQVVCSLFDINLVNATVVKIYEKSNPSGWVEFDKIFPIPNTNYFVEMIEVEGYNHYALFSYENLLLMRILTSGPYHVSGIASFSPFNNRLYYLSNEGNTWERNLFSVDITEGASSKQKITVSPSFVSASFSPNSEFYILSYEGPEIPFQSIKQLSDEGFNTVLESNEDLSNKLSFYDLPQKEFFNLTISPPNHEFSQSFDVPVCLILPPYFNKSKKYGLIVKVYGGPSSYAVQSNFVLDWSTFMSSTHNFVIAMIDGRGSSVLKNNLKYSVYKQLGKYESRDQIVATQMLLSERKYIDREKVYIWGWSYGGYLSSKVVEADFQKIFKRSVAVAPVSDWLYYDTIYTERYMALVEENPFGYESSAVNNYTSFQGTQFLLIHGTADDNVHAQHSFILSDELTENEVDFLVHFYTDSNHRINKTKKTFSDIYKRITNFFLFRDEL